MVDLDRYIDKQVIVSGCVIYLASNDGASMMCGGVTFKIIVDGIDRETFRYFLKNCSGLGEQPNCRMPVFATPIGKKWGSSPLLKDVKIVP